MRNLVLASAAIAILVSTVGCANGPIRNWLRGAPCNTCNPQFNQPHDNMLGGCNTGTCATGTCGTGVCNSQPANNGILGGLFRGNQNAQNTLPQSLPASSFETTPEISGGGELYGNTESVGRIELPPNGPFN